VARKYPVPYWSRRTALLMLGLIGSLALANVVVRLWRLRANSDDIFVLGFLAVGIVATWFLCFMHMRALDKLTDQSQEKILVRLSSTAYAMGFFGYLMIIEVLSLMHPLPH